MKNSVHFNISSICPEKATVFYGENHSHCSDFEIADQLSLNLKSEPIVSCEPVPHDLRLGSERYGFTVEQGAKGWVCPVQLRPLETWRLGFWLEEQGHEVELDRLSAVLETMIDGGVA